MRILEEAKGLYLKGNSIRKTAKMLSSEYGCGISHEILRRKLKDAGIVRNNSEAQKACKRSHLPIQKIIGLYIGDKISLRTLAKMFKSNKRTIHKILEENGISVKDSSEANKLFNTKYVKLPFSGDEYEKAYITGLVKSDVHARAKSKYTLRLTTGSTHPAFINMFRQVFEKYGSLYVYPVKYHSSYQWNITADLDFSSFNFLLLNNNAMTLNYDKNTFISFISGLIDADGSICIKKVREYFQYVIKIFGEDKKLLEKIKTKFYEFNIKSEIYLYEKKGSVRILRGRTIKYNNDYYCLEIWRRENVMTILKALSLKHPEKIAKRKLIYDFENKGFKKWNQVEDPIIELRRKIKDAVNKTVEDAQIKYENRNKA
ncbi:MAG: hypothetical protein GOV02_01440 [Candidatus Aenigmarchaeota archaeon]|nr:hypothetical protein [Candidatus Aenigmarchaeota archaeon]